MDYVVGSVAALISGNVTPNRPKLVRRALTPTKHQPSPNVTPKSEFVDDRSIFLSPTLQKKKAIVKKSPKRIFQNPDLDPTSENDDSNSSSPKADKVKKHLNEKLEADSSGDKRLKSPKSPKRKHNKSAEVSPPRITPEFESPQSANENTPKKQKKRKNSGDLTQISETVSHSSPEKTKKKNKRLSESLLNEPRVEDSCIKEETPKKKKKKSLNLGENNEKAAESELCEEKENVRSPKKKNKKRKNKSKSKFNQTETETEENQDKTEVTAEKTKKSKKKHKDEHYVNPNAITDKDSDSEHESDDDIVSENEEANKEILDTGPAEDSSDEEEEVEPKKGDSKEKVTKPRTDDDVKRTIFVGNVPFSKKCKKEIKKIFSKYGNIETVRIRTVPVKDARVTPKLAVIKNELHPERTTVNVYVKYKDASSVEQALTENNTVLNNCHLRVSRSETSGAEHDPRCSVFVGNVPFALEDETLREKFEKCGEIVSVRIIRDRKTNAGKGFAYVNFASKDGVELALALPEEDLTIKNRIMRVKRCTQTTHKQKNQESKGFQGKHQGQNGQNKNQFGRKGGSFKPRGQDVPEGASRRIMHKRKNQDGNDGPPHKRQKNLNQPHKEKKTRKEFVGMTAEKKKKHTFNKGQKKKKALSEILTKYS